MASFIICYIIFGILLTFFNQADEFLAEAESVLPFRAAGEFEYLLVIRSATESGSAQQHAKRSHRGRKTEIPGCALPFFIIVFKRFLDQLTDILIPGPLHYRHIEQENGYRGSLFRNE